MSEPLDVRPWSPAATTRAARLEVLALATLAIGVRIAFPSAAFFGVDQVGTLENGRAVLAGHLFVPGPGIGWSSLTLGPLYNQVAAVALALRDSFADVVALVAALHGLSVVGFRALLLRIVDPPVARLAALFLALHPNSVVMGASPISSSLVLPTTLLFVIGIVFWIERRDARGFALACLGAALMVQAHASTLSLLPLFLVGFARRAPVGDLGLIGLLASLLLLSSTISDNLRSGLAQPERLHHARGAGASFFVAAGRALFLEARVASFGADDAGWLARAATVAGFLSGGITCLGLVDRLRRPGEPTARLLLFFGFVLPTLAVLAIPRGALHYYLDQTLPYRALACAYGVIALARWMRAAGPVVVAAVLAAVVSTTHIVALRMESHASGNVRVRLARVDLRDPDDTGVGAISIPTIASQQRLGESLGRLGGVRADLPERIRGPWRWVLAHSTPAFVPVAASDARVDHADPSRGFLVLHRDESLSVPDSGPQRIGAFRVHPFVDRSSSLEGEASPSYRLEPTDTGLVVHVVLPLGVDAVRVTVDGRVHPFVPHRTAAGFLVHEGRLPPYGVARTLRLEGLPRDAEGPLVRAGVDAYAFETRVARSLTGN